VRYRWKEHRPRFRLTLEAPAPGPLAGIVGVEALWERQSYEPTDDPLREERRRVGLSLGDWLTDRVQWMVGGASDDFHGRTFVSFSGHVDTRWFDDRVTGSVAVSYWTPTGGGEPFATSDVQVAWRSTADLLRPGWLAQAGVFAVHSDAPLAVWPVAGSGESRGPLLRGHELHNRGVIVSDVFGQRLAFATAEYRRPVYSRKQAAVALAGFVDVSRAWRHPFGTPIGTQVDVGAGLRIAAPGSDDQLRLDVGYGLRDGATKFSAGYIVPWGR
jgi:hypothetical protein